MIKSVSSPNPSIFIDVSIQIGATPFKIDTSCQCGHFGSCSFSEKQCFVLKLAGMLDFRFINDFLKCSIPRAPSSSNHMWTRIVGTMKFDLYPKFPQCFPLSRNVSIFVHPCRPFEPDHFLLLNTLPFENEIGVHHL